MGVLIWHEYARIVSLTASVYVVWASFWATIYRKFFWDFVGGTFRDPGGYQPADGAAIFVTVIVKMPIVPILAMVMGLSLIALEYGIPQVKATSVGRSLILRVVLLIFQALFAILFYQGTNGAIYSLTAAVCYTRAIILGETMAVAKENKGRGGKA